MSGAEPPVVPPRLTGAIGDSGLIGPGSGGVVLLSGGPDSICLLAGLAALGDVDIAALHLNYGLRDESDDDQAVCESACERLGIELVVKQAGSPDGNVQDWARRLRYEAAEELRAARGADWIAVGHTRDDAAETVLYRLAVSPGRRAVAAMNPSSGRIVRPLLALTRGETREIAAGTGLGFADDATNHDPAFARVRIREEVLPVLEEINPAAAANIALTRAELIEEGEFLDSLADDLLDRGLDGEGRLSVTWLEGLHPAMRRLVIRTLAERRTGQPAPVPIALAAEALRLAAGPEGGSLDLGGGHRLVAEAGTLTVIAAGEATGSMPGVEVGSGGSAVWGDWSIRVDPLDPPFEPAGPEVATLDGAALEPRLLVRGWEPGDRIRPLGLDGSKSLQDLFTDAGVPRSGRGRVPVVVSGDEIVWVAGIAVADRHRIGPDTKAAIRVSAART